MIKRLVIVAVAALMSLALVGCAGAEDISSADGAQIIRVSATGIFAPERAARAGAPIRLDFGPGSGCTAAVKFPEHGIFEDLTDGGGVVDLPALPSGRYPLICQADMIMGTLIVN
ncbi:MAG: hypothetical protein CVT60_02085 [Actinobacteria bacterium HGW-Actinobacteria-10]|jgi:hypothetical protein|nr:MAG: hypothetical protein CVT60_02085 [Actinobacteria bacterium HGW-Actinobacteria-10]